MIEGVLGGVLGGVHDQVMSKSLQGIRKNDLFFFSEIRFFFNPRPIRLNLRKHGLHFF
jgi:hypothetical protein